MQRRLLMAGLVGLVAACERQDPVVKAALTAAPPDPPQPVPMADIVDRKWVVDSLTPSSDNAFDWSRIGINIRLVSKDQRAGGYSGCNTFSAPYRSDGDGNLSFGPAVATRMACAEPKGVMGYESEFLNALARVKGYGRSEDHLYFHLDGGGEITLIRDNVSSG